MSEGFLKRNGDVRSLLVYRIATMISVLTEHFVTMFVSSKSRTVDQMQQAASASRCAEPESTIEIIT